MHRGDLRRLCRVSPGKYLLPLFFPALSSPAPAAVSFDELCEKDASGDFVHEDIVNCWGFESEDDIFYRIADTTQCTDDAFLQNHPNGVRNAEPINNASVNSNTCLYPKIDNSKSTSGEGSLRITQTDRTKDKNGGGTFHPYMKVRRDGSGYKLAAFGVGGEFWIHFRYRQDDGLFNYHSKRFMVTHRRSYFEEVLIARNAAGGTYVPNTRTIDPPYNRLCAYNHKGTGRNAQSHGCAKARLKSDFWHRILIHIKMSDNTEDRMDRNFKRRPDGLPDLNNGDLEVFLDGKRILFEDQLKMHQLDLFEPYTEDLDWDTQSGIDAYFRLDFLLYENKKKPVGRPDGNMWIDDVVISRAPIPDIGGNDKGRGDANAR